MTVTGIKNRIDGPVRSCVVCRRKFPKDVLERYVKSSGGLVKGAKLPGRGLYLCGDETCRSRFFKKRKVKN